MEFSKFLHWIRGCIQHYNHNKYWRYREKVLNYKTGKMSKIINIVRLFYIKKCDAFNKATLGTHLGFGAFFGGIPSFPHGLYGIIISHNVTIGKNCTIFHNVTIGEGKGGAPKIGDDVMIGTGSIIIGDITIGDRVKIGAGSVVTKSVPSDCTVVSSSMRIIYKT